MSDKDSTENQGRHTPGPWRMEASWVEGFDYQIIALTADRNDTRTVALTVADDAKANANLIAAAPELLEALETIMDRAETWINMNLDDEVGDKARAAIAKANGASHE